MGVFIVGVLCLEVVSGRRNIHKRLSPDLIYINDGVCHNFSQFILSTLKMALATGLSVGYHGLVLRSKKCVIQLVWAYVLIFVVFGPGSYMNRAGY